ncbi:MAG: NAD-dependent epimerase/dehydratase family protein [Desulfuromonadales bacterium]|nr:NAD-dependent epimerase/dehydratase family protein [Desulfuromonadales bacterium]
MKALVTGATGFVGANLVRQLLKEGFDVRVIARSVSDRRNLDGLDIEVFEGDIIDKGPVLKAVKGCDVVYHAAADYRLWAKDPKYMYRVNVDGTKNILEAALTLGTSKVVYTSSVGTLGNRGDGTPGDEETPVTFDDMVGHYKKSKFLAERAADSFVKQGLPLVIVNPSTPVGGNDIKPTPTGKIIVDFLNGKMPAYLDTGLNIIDVEECAKGHILAAKKGKIGEKYILGGENLTLREILDTLSEISGKPAPKIRLPYFPILVAAHLNEAVSKITGKEPLIPLAGVRMAAKKMFFNSAKAEKELGLQVLPARQALEKSVEWFIKNGYID